MNGGKIRMCIKGYFTIAFVYFTYFTSHKLWYFECIYITKLEKFSLESDLSLMPGLMNHIAS